MRKDFIPIAEAEMSQRKIILLFIATFFIIASTHIVSAVRQKAAAASSSESTIGLEESESALHMKSTDELITFWKARFDRDPQDFISLTYLGQSYIRKGRETGDVSAYGRAEAALRKSLNINPDYETTLALLSADLFVQHNFQGALDLANRVYVTDPRALQALATIGDAQLELGNYSDAAVAYRTLNEKNPRPSVDSRLARLTWLQGNPDKALALMQQAVDESTQAGLSGENLAWYHFQLGELYFNTGQLEKADTQYSAALDAFNNYYLALAGRGKVRAAQGDYDKAIAFYEQAVRIIPQPDLLAALGDLYTLTDDSAKAKHEYDTVEFIGKLQAINQVIYNRQLALFYANHNIKVDESLNLAQKEITTRKDIYAYDTLAWALYKNGRYSEAADAIKLAMKLGTRDALLYYHAGMIYEALGDDDLARTMLSQALKINPHFDLMQSHVARLTLASLRKH